MKAALHLLALAAALAVGSAAHAGRTCEARAPTVDAVQRSLMLATRTAQALDASGAEVVLLARAGQDLSTYGLRWSHVGWAHKDPQGGPGWRVVHKLNACGSDRAALWRQGLGEFFLDDPWRYEAAFSVPPPAVQARLHVLLRNDGRVATLNQSAYSMVAYPWATRYQQSNQWAIETLAMAQAPDITDRERAQAWLRLAGYQPTTLKLGPLARLGARVSAANVAFDDHPPEKRFADRIETVTADSVFAWLNRSGLGGAPQFVR